MIQFCMIRQGSASEGEDGTLLVCVKEAQVSPVPLGLAAAYAQQLPAAYRLVTDGLEVCGGTVVLKA